MEKMTKIIASLAILSCSAGLHAGPDSKYQSNQNGYGLDQPQDSPNYGNYGQDPGSNQSYKTPGGYNQNPGGYSQNQGSYNQNPDSYNQNPGSYNQNPGGYNQNPGSYNQTPGSYNKNPGNLNPSGSYNQTPSDSPPAGGNSKSSANYNQRSNNYSKTNYNAPSGYNNRAISWENRNNAPSPYDLLPGTSDDDISSNVRRSLHNDKGVGDDSKGIQVSVSSGTVTLTGVVPNEDEKSKAAAIAKQVNGVKSVSNKLNVAN